MDVRKGPLERAEEHVEEVGLSGKIELRLVRRTGKIEGRRGRHSCDRRNGRKTDLPDSGTGTPCVGELERGKRTPDSVAAVGAGRSASFPGRTGIFDSREAMLTDEGKYYIVIEAARGTMRPGREQDYRFGADLIRKKDPVLLAYLEKEEKMTRQVLAGLTENDAQNKKKTLEASEAGEAADQPPWSAHQRTDRLSGADRGDET